MGWFKDTFTPEPIECPRGWGSVTFVLKFLLIPPIVAIGRGCPIGGVTDCAKCRYSVNPDSAELLRQRIEELGALRGSTLTEAEYRIRRRLIVEAREPRPGVAGESAAAAALVLGPLGVVTIAAGWYLAVAVHPGFLGLLGGGLVLSALAVGFAGLSVIQRRELPGRDDPHFDELPEGTRDLEVELQRAREELGFLRELHGPGSLEPVRRPDADDPSSEAP